MPRDHDDQRAPLDTGRLVEALAGDAFFVDVVASAETGSTNADVAVLARAGAPEGTVRTTDLQTAGRGRLARAWTSPAGAGIAVSVLLRPDRVPRERWSWLPLLAGLAVLDAVGLAGLGPGSGAALKWPNDVLVGDRKLAGVLVEVVATPSPAAVVGIGLNVTNEPAELPHGLATSLAMEGAAGAERSAVLVDLLRALAGTYGSWTDAGGEPSVLRAAYAERCATIGRVVRAELPAGRTVEGTATGIDEGGRLVLATADGPVVLGAGDVVHVR